MRILYIGDRLRPESGVTHKMVRQAWAWELAGHEAYLTTFREPVPLRVGDAERKLAQMGAARTPRTSLLQRVGREAQLRLLNYGRLAWEAEKRDIDVIYTRELSGVGAGRELVFAHPCTVLEIASDSVAEARDPRDAVRRHELRRSQLRHSAGIVYASRELQAACGPVDAPQLVLANGCPEPRPGKRRRPQRPTLALICAAHHPWAGADKFVWLARQLPDLEFVLIGDERGGPSNLTSYPQLPEARADEILRGCTVGVGPLALHRKRMLEASPLKSRHYLALGLPIIQAYQDTDLRPQAAVLQLDNREDNLADAVPAIEAFARRAHTDDTLHQQALALAAGPLSVREKEHTRLAFFERLRAAGGATDTSAAG